MHIQQLTIKNFRKFESLTLKFDPNFNLIVGVNASGKTSIMEALSIAIGSWFLGIDGSATRSIWSEADVRLKEINLGGIKTFEPQYPIRVETVGCVENKIISWVRSIEGKGRKTTHGGASSIKTMAAEAALKVSTAEDIVLPLLGYYGTGRLWLTTRTDSLVVNSKTLAKKKDLSRLAGYRFSIEPRISIPELVKWIATQSWIEYQDGGKTSQVFKAVKKAMIDCVEDANNLYFDPKSGEVIIQFDKQPSQPFFHLSDGQRIMLAMVGDIAQRAARLNPHLGKSALLKTPGVVLIDELDLHLHPRWQRRIIADLKRIFPKIQFVCTTHSPQLIGQAKPEEIILLDESGTATAHPSQSFGMDSNWILKHVMKGEDRDAGVERDLTQLFKLIDDGELDSARAMLPSLRLQLSGEHPDLIEAEGLIHRFEREALGEEKA